MHELGDPCPGFIAAEGALVAHFAGMSAHRPSARNALEAEGGIEPPYGALQKQQPGLEGTRGYGRPILMGRPKDLRGSVAS